jgi:hypothetical protein
MENRDRDKISKGTGSTPDSDVNRDKSADFGQKVGRGENIESEQGSRQSGSIGSSGMQSDRGRSSGSSDVSDSDREDLKKNSGYRGGNRGGSGIGSEHL